MTDTDQSELGGVLRDILRQQTAMLQVQAENARLQRVLVERLLGVSDKMVVGADETRAVAAAASAGATTVPLATANMPVPTPAAMTPLSAEEAPPVKETIATSDDLTPAQPQSDLPFAPAPVDQNPARGARYYQSRPSQAARTIAPEQLELMRSLQEMRDASDLILQFGPFKGSTLAQVTMSNPEYIRQLMTGAQRPEVRAAAGRLVRALDAAAEHKRKTTRSSARRGRPTR